MSILTIPSVVNYIVTFIVWAVRLKQLNQVFLYGCSIYFFRLVLNFVISLFLTMFCFHFTIRFITKIKPMSYLWIPMVRSLRFVYFLKCASELLSLFKFFLIPFHVSIFVQMIFFLLIHCNCYTWVFWNIKYQLYIQYNTSQN